MAERTYAKGLHDVGASTYAYLQPNGSWGWSNAGLIADGDATLLVDTLFDLRLTREMLDAMRRAVPAAAAIDVLVNTHGDPDHTFGNQLVGDAQIVATARAAEEMLAGATPAALQELLAQAPRMGVAGDYVSDAFGAFDFSDVRLVPPSRTFGGELALTVGDLEVQLIELGPAHTGGDAVVHVPAQRVVFAGDVLFAGVHPVTWDGSVGGWIAACERLLALDVDAIVPGHGPIAGKDDVRALRDYLAHVQAEAVAGWRAQLPAHEVARRIELAPYAGWCNPERVVTTVDAVYRERAGEGERADQIALIAETRNRG